MPGESSHAMLHVTSTLRGDGRATIAVAGAVDRAAVQRLTSLLVGLRAAGATRVVVDLSRVSSCDHSLLTVLERVRCQVEDSGGWLVVDGSPATLSEYAELPLDAVFRIYRDACGAGAAVVGAS